MVSYSIIRLDARKRDEVSLAGVCRLGAAALYT